MSARNLEELSRPRLTGFSPDVIPWQRKLFDLVRDFPYEKGILEILLSGAYGSAKSTPMAHLAVRHCLENPGARVMLARRALPDLRATIWNEVLEHIDEDRDPETNQVRGLIEKVDYRVNHTRLWIRFRNGSRIICGSWADRKYRRFRSLKLSMLVVEELVENDAEDEEAYKELRARVGRVPEVKQNIIISATNPDSPAHWVYKRLVKPFEEGYDDAVPLWRRVFVFYSRTLDNVFLPDFYVENLRDGMSPAEADRYLEGKWNELRRKFIYSEYRSEVQYFAKREWKPIKSMSIHVTFDFNIGDGKPLSCALFQYDKRADTFHVFAESVVDAARTEDVLEDLAERGLLEPGYHYVINGDASGKHRDTRSKRSDYQIIADFFRGRGLNFETQVPTANPPIRKRHNTVNAYCRNAHGRVRLYVYKGCKTVDEGMRLTSLKKGAEYKEDDSKPFQHITTAIGYGILSTIARAKQTHQGTTQL